MYWRAKELAMKSVISRKITFPEGAVPKNLIVSRFEVELNSVGALVAHMPPEVLRWAVTIEVEQAEGKTVRKDLSEMLYDALVRKSDVTSWTQKQYYFDFADKLFRVNGEEIYLTHGERLLLFRLLVLKEAPVGAGGEQARATMRRLRRRLGEDFLRGCFVPEVGIY